MKFSFIIPVAPGRRADIVDSINNLDYPESRFEVIVIRGENPSANRNQGAGQARGEILVFLDDDAGIPDDYLRRAEDFFLKYPRVDIVGGPQLTAEDDKAFSRISWYALSSVFGAWKVSSRYAVGRTRLDVDETAVSSANLLCRKEVLTSVTFDTELFPGEDPKFIAEAKKAGFQIAYSPDIRLYHRRRPTPAALMRQIFSYGKTRPRKESLRETMKMPFFFVPSFFLMYLAVLAAWLAAPLLFSGGGPRTATVPGFLWLPLAVYLPAAVCFGIYDAARNRDCKAALVLPFIYPAIHLSYGLGMIWGYLKKMRRKP